MVLQRGEPVLREAGQLLLHERREAFLSSCHSPLWPSSVSATLKVAEVVVRGLLVANVLSFVIVLEGGRLETLFDFFITAFTGFYKIS